MQSTQSPLLGPTKWPDHGQHTPLHLLIGVSGPLEEIQLVNILSKMPHCVHFISDGDMAISAVKAAKFDVILLSYQLSDYSASTTARKIKKISPDTPIITFLPKPDKKFYTECINAGVNSFICPPITSEKLIGLLDFYKNIKA
jgi:PleD family two-component response regulator